MNQVLSLVRAARTVPDSGSGLDTPQLLSELLILNEEMVAQLRLERLQDPRSAEFLTDMIAQHERAAATLRTQLDSAECDAS